MCARSGWLTPRMQRTHTGVQFDRDTSRSPCRDGAKWVGVTEKRKRSLFGKDGRSSASVLCASILRNVRDLITRTDPKPISPCFVANFFHPSSLFVSSPSVPLPGRVPLYPPPSHIYLGFFASQRSVTEGLIGPEHHFRSLPFQPRPL